MEMERPRRDDGQQQMDTQANHVGPQRRQKERGWTRWADQLKRLAGDRWSRSARDRGLWKELEKTLTL